MSNEFTLTVMIQFGLLIVAILNLILATAKIAIDILNDKKEK